MLDASLPASATFAVGEQEMQLGVRTVDDTTNEDDSMVAVSLQKGFGHRLGVTETEEATVTVLDDDAGPGRGATPASAGVTVWAADTTVVDLGNGSIGGTSADLLAHQRGSAGIQAKSLWYYAPDRKLQHVLHGGRQAHRGTDAACRGMCRLACGEAITAIPGTTWTSTGRAVRRSRRARCGARRRGRHLPMRRSSRWRSRTRLAPRSTPRRCSTRLRSDSGMASVTLSAAANDDDAGGAFG